MDSGVIEIEWKILKGGKKKFRVVDGVREKRREPTIPSIANEVRTTFAVIDLYVRFMHGLFFSLVANYFRFCVY